MKNSWLVIPVLLWISACGPKLEEEVISSWPDGQPQKIQYYEVSGDSRTLVKETKFHENGQKEMEGGFVNGKKQGLWTAWFDNGQKQSEGFYENDLRNGKATVWRDNGFVYYEGYYSMGKLHGTWTFYDIDGSRNKQVLFEHDQKIEEIDLKN